jgi:ERCC4-related helicase
VSLFEVGNRVRIVGGAAGVITETFPDLVPPSYRVFLSGMAQPIVAEPDLESDSAADSDLVALLRQGAFATLEQFRFALTQRKLTDQLTTTLFSYNAARIQIEPHQFKPLLKILESPYRRLLIADEVGLGKTIEAGIVLNELDLREGFDRVLVACPHALLFKWRDELDSKFGMRFEIWSRARFQTWLGDATRNRIPEAARAIVSLESIRSDDIINSLEQAPVMFDMLIVDEAHHLRNNETQSYALGEALAAASDVILFLSATPLNLRNRDLFNLVHLLLPDVYSNEETFDAQLASNQSLNLAARLLRAGAANSEVRAAAVPVLNSTLGKVFRDSDRFADLLNRLESSTLMDREERVRAQQLCAEMNTLGGVLTRTRKVEVAPFAVRQPHSIHLKFSTVERAFYDAVTAFCIECYSGGSGQGFGATTYQRQLCSCIPAMRQILVRIETSSLDVGWNDGMEDEADDTTMGKEERRLLEEALVAGERVGPTDTKYTEFAKLVEELLGRQAVRRVMVFSFFRGTVAYLEQRLRQNWKVGVIIGGTPLDERSKVVDQFRKGEFEVLLSSEVGSEGLDFQFCNVLVNYDLPWNPMRVEQRIGRLDRYGQTHDKILIYNLLVDDTVEARIFGRLFERIELFKASIGDLEAILGESVTELTRTAMDPALDDDQQAKKTEALAQQLISRRKYDEELSLGKDSLLMSEQYLLDRFDSMERGRAYLTAAELSNFVALALEQHFDKSTLTSQGSRRWLRPDNRFAEYVRREIYEPGADGRLHRGNHVLRSLTRLRVAAQDGTAIPVTFDSNTAFGDSELELLSPQHPYVQALARRVHGTSLNRMSCIRVNAAALTTVGTGRFLVVIYKVQSSGSRPLKRLETVLANTGDMSVRRMDGDWLGTLVESASDDVSDSPLLARTIIEQAIGLADQLVLSTLEDQRTEMDRRQKDVLGLKVSSLEYSFARKRERLNTAIRTVDNAAIKRLRTAELANATARHEEMIRELAAEERVVLTRDRVGILDLTVGLP